MPSDRRPGAPQPPGQQGGQRLGSAERLPATSAVAPAAPIRSRNRSPYQRFAFTVFTMESTASMASASTMKPQNAICVFDTAQSTGPLQRVTLRG